MTARTDSAAAPEVSVIIPAFGREAALTACLDALAAQSLPANRFEVIVCDDGSRVPLSNALQEKAHASGERLQLRIVRQPNSGPAVARNRAVAAARGKYLAFTDDDCRPAPDWLERLLQHFEAHPDALIGGGLRGMAHADRYARATQAIMSFVYAEQARRGGVFLFSTSNLALPASGFRKIGGFSAVFKRAAGEDYDLCARWCRAGGETVYAPDVLVTHDHAMTLRGFFNQHFSYGHGLLLMRRRSRQGGLPLRRGSFPGSFHLRLIASPFSSSGMRGTGAASLIALSQVATALGALAGLRSE